MRRESGVIDEYISQWPVDVLIGRYFPVDIYRQDVWSNYLREARKLSHSLIKCQVVRGMGQRSLRECTNYVGFPSSSTTSTLLKQIILKKFFRAKKQKADIKFYSREENCRGSSESFHRQIKAVGAPGTSRWKCFHFYVVLQEKHLMKIINWHPTFGVGNHPINPGSATAFALIAGSTELRLFYVQHKTTHQHDQNRPLYF